MLNRHSAYVIRIDFQVRLSLEYMQFYKQLYWRLQPFVASKTVGFLQARYLISRTVTVSLLWRRLFDVHVNAVHADWPIEDTRLDEYVK